MVLVTPYIVRAVAQKDLSRPDDGFADASDPQADLLGSINRIYGVPGRVEPAPELSRHLRLYHRLRRDEDNDDDSQNHPPIASRALRLAGALVGLAVALGACTHTERRGDREHSRRLSPASSDRDPGSRPRRSSSSSAMRAAASPLRSAPT